jgi:hypothetical protein
MIFLGLDAGAKGIVAMSLLLTGSQCSSIIFLSGEEG